MKKKMKMAIVLALLFVFLLLACAEGNETIEGFIVHYGLCAMCAYGVYALTKVWEKDLDLDKEESSTDK